MTCNKFININKCKSLGLILFVFISGCDSTILNPAGPITSSQKTIIITALILMLLVVVPVIFLTLYFSWKYRASNTKAKYTPDWCHNYWLEFTWWLIPCLIIVALATITWITSHSLDPYRKISSKEETIDIQVVSLNWKWLFIYPKENIATINYLQIPKGKTAHFYITADGPMNSFWISQLGSQIMTMPGMQTQLHLVGSKTGTYRGVSANYSGHGFSGMSFDVKVSTDTEYEQWIKKVKTQGEALTEKLYVLLSAPSRNNPVVYYSSVEDNLYSNIMMQYMMPNMPITKLKAKEQIITD